MEFYGPLYQKATPSSGVGDDLSTRDATTGEMGKITSAVTALTSGNIFVGNGSNVPASVTMSGDVTINSSGVTAISSGVIVNADVSGSAAIAYSKLAALTASRALVSDGSGFVSVASVTSTEVGYLSGVSSNLQTQLNAKQASITGGASTITTSNLTPSRALVSNGSGKVAVATTTATEIGYVNGVTSAIQTQIDGKLSVTLSSVADGDIIIRSGGSWVNLAKGSNGQHLVLSGGIPAWSSVVVNEIPAGGTAEQILHKVSGTDYDVAWHTPTLSDLGDVTASAAEVNILSGATLTTTELNYVDGVTGPIQSQIDSKQSVSLAQGYIWVGNSGGVAAATGPGSNGQVLTISGGVPSWQTLSGTGTVTSVAISGGTTGLSVSGSPITTSGTITLSGTLVAANGGTGQTSYSTGDILYASGATALSKLSAGSDGDVLTLASGVPSWATPSAGGTVTSVSGTADRITVATGTTTPVLDIASTYVGQTSIVTLGTVTTGTWNATTISVAKGGTGLTSLGTANQLLRVNAGATALEYFTPSYLTTNQTITLSGDVSGSGSTSITATLGSNVVGDSIIRQSSGLSVIGRSTNTTGNVADITAGTDGHVLRRSGTSLTFGEIPISSVTNLQTSLDAKLAATVTTNRQTASYTLVLSDASKMVEMNSASANNLTVPSNASVAFSTGTQILISQYGAGQTTIVADTGVTIRSRSGFLKLGGQYSGAALVKIGTDEWYLQGDITS